MAGTDTEDVLSTSMSQTRGRTSTVTSPENELRIELRREASTMSLYIAISLLAALLAVSEVGRRGTSEVVGIIWGTTLGLALAHLFAFRLSARLVGGGRVDRHDARIAAAQLVGAAVVALLASVAVLIAGDSAELDAVRLALAGYVALVGYEVAISNGSTRVRALVYAAAVMTIALAVAITKNVLTGH